MSSKVAGQFIMSPRPAVAVSPMMDSRLPFRYQHCRPLSSMSTYGTLSLMAAGTRSTHTPGVSVTWVSTSMIE